MPSDGAKPSRQDQAAAWFAAERAGMMLVEQRAEFDAWRADPRNQTALDDMRSLWRELEVLKGHEPAPKKVAPVRSRLPFVAAVACALVTGLVATALLLRPEPNVIVTADGQQRTETMPDGSVVAVNVASNVSYSFTDTARIVTLVNGEAAFSVKADPGKPFVVRVGDFEVRAVGTSFNVRERDGSIQVAVSEGRVVLCRATATGEQVVFAYLNAGELLKLPDATGSGFASAAPVSVPPSNVSEWRMRVVSYEDATVKEVVDDLNRYFAHDLSVEGPELLEHHITIRLRVDDRERAIETLASLLDAKITRAGGRDILGR
jgi:transmembrane sensor